MREELGMTCGGWMPIPSTDGSAVDPGRLGDKSEHSIMKTKHSTYARTRDMKCDAGACEIGVILKTFDAMVAPSGLLSVRGGTSCAIRENWGKASPKMPEKAGPSNSFSTASAAAMFHLACLCRKDVELTHSLR